MAFPKHISAAIPLFSKLRGVIALPGDSDGMDAARSSYERFAIPYSFKPQLSLIEATIAAAGAFLRIFLGSVLFGFCGAYTIVAFQTIKNPLVRVLVVLAMVVLFAFLLAVLLFAISAIARRLWPHQPAAAVAPPGA